MQLFYLIKIWHTLTRTPYYGYFGHQGDKIKINNVISSNYQILNIAETVNWTTSYKAIQGTKTDT